MSMSVYDCFTYFNEEELLKVRLEELRDVVDYFVIVEATSTFTGNAKPLYFDSVKLDDEITKKIIRVKIDFPDHEMSSWDREIFQRNAILQGLDSADDDDLIIISDADEIPNPIAILSIDLNELPVQLDVDQFFWDKHWQVPAHCNQGARPVITTKGTLNHNTPQELRAAQLARIPSGGWHFSFFGTGEKVRYKIESFAHTEYNTDKYKNQEKLLYRIENGIDPFDRFPLKYREVDSTYPKAMQ